MTPHWTQNTPPLDLHPALRTHRIDATVLVQTVPAQAETEELLRLAAGEQTDTLLETLGPERVMFGSDWPVCLLAAGYDQVIDAAEELTADLDPQQRDAVFGTAAAHWYGIAS